MSNIDNFLAHLKGVKSIGKNRWVACCPAHKDKKPSLSISLTDKDVILFICRAGCGQHEVMKASGVDPAELFPPRVLTGRRGTPGRYRPDFELKIRNCVRALHEMVIAGFEKNSPEREQAVLLVKEANSLLVQVQKWEMEVAK